MVDEAKIPNPESGFPKTALARSVQSFPKVDESGDVGSNVVAGNAVWWFASAGDSILKWGVNTQTRDRQLRGFWPSEPYLADAVYQVSARNSAYEWELDGPEMTVDAVQNVLDNALIGNEFGWIKFVLGFSQDLYTTDNGGFIEIIRDPSKDVNSKFRNENAPVVGIGHLDSQLCQRTGNPKQPIIYTDPKTMKRHRLNWWDVISTSEFPSPIKTMYGVGHCAVSRVLRLAQIMQGMEVFKDEKIGGRHYRSIHFVGGVSRQEIDDVMARGKEDADNRGQVRYIDPAILASLDPEKPVSTATLDLASLPDGFDFDAEMKWYITGLAAGFGVDYQDFAPLPSSSIGSGAQSEMLHQKSRGKGPALFMETIARAFQFYGILPKGVTFSFKAKETAEELSQQEIRTKASEEMAIAVRSGLLTAEAARSVLVRRGIYEPEDVAGIPDDFGLEFFDPAARQTEPNKQMVGATGAMTAGEDARRTA